MLENDENLAKKNTGGTGCIGLPWGRAGGRRGWLAGGGASREGGGRGRLAGCRLAAATYM